MPRNEVYPNNEIWVTFILDSMEAIREFIVLIMGFKDRNLLQLTDLHWIAILRPGGAARLMEDA